MRSLPATDAQSLASQIKVGDKINIIRNDLTEVTFEVTAVSDKGISGNGVFVAYSDIRQVQVRHFSTVKTVSLVVVIVAAVTIVIASLLSKSVGFSGN